MSDSNKEKSTIPTKVSEEDGIWGHAHWWILIAALIFYIGGHLYTHIDWVDIKWDEIAAIVFSRIGETIIVGVLIAFFSSYKYIIKGYQDELKKLLLGTEYLETRNDIGEIWDRISEIVCRTKFPTIAKQLLKLIKTKYLVSKDNIRCYHDYDTTIKIEWDTEDKKWVKITDHAKFCLYADTDQAIELIQNYSTDVSTENDGTAAKMILQCESSQDVQNGQFNGASPNSLACAARLTLSGKTEYNIIKTINRRLCLTNDNFIGFRAKYITNGMSIKVSHPKDMRLSIAERGTIENFSINKINETTCEYRYNGLILPRQGYIICMTRIY